MPRIRAYKQADKLIPVADAKVVTAFQCPWTKKLYNRKKDYIKHLKELRQERIHRNIVNNRLGKALADLQSQPNFESIIEWIERNSWFWLAKAKRNRTDWRDNEGWPAPEEFWIKITFLELMHIPIASNTHSAPRGQRTNWGGDISLPRGYPGWVGRIEYQMSHDLPIFSSDLFRSTGICTGGGGGSSENRYGYSVTFWDDDWPRLSEGVVLNILAEKPHHKYVYGQARYFR